MKTDIMGIAFDNVTMQEALDKASAILQGDKTCYAVTPNAEIAYEAMKDERLRALINGADLVLPDGAGVVLASKLLKTPLKQKVAGVDFADGLLGILAESGRSVYLLGASVRSMPNETASPFSAAISTERCPPEPQTGRNFKI